MCSKDATVLSNFHKDYSEKEKNVQDIFPLILSWLSTVITSRTPILQLQELFHEGLFQKPFNYSNADFFIYYRNFHKDFSRNSSTIILRNSSKIGMESMKPIINFYLLDKFHLGFSWLFYRISLLWFKHFIKNIK